MTDFDFKFDLIRIILAICLLVVIVYICLPLIGVVLDDILAETESITTDVTDQTETLDIPEKNNIENETTGISFAEIVAVILITITFIVLVQKSILQTQNERLCDIDFDNNSDETVPEKFEELYAKIRIILEEKFMADSITYCKYDSAIESAISQYNKNKQDIKSYEKLKKEVSKKKREKIQPKIDELKDKNNSLLSGMEDLYIKLSLNDDNDNDKNIKTLQEVTEQLKYYTNANVSD